MNVLLSARRPSRLAVLGLLGAATLLTGCMASPYHLEDIGAANNTVIANGFVTEPNATVAVQYFSNASGTWQTLGTTQSSGAEDTFQWSGQSWNSWNLPGLLVPSDGWTPSVKHGQTARIRARSDSTTLFTFDDHLAYCFDDQETMGELWRDCGHGNEVTITARN